MNTSVTRHRKPNLLIYASAHPYYATHKYHTDHFTGYSQDIFMPKVIVVEFLSWHSSLALGNKPTGGCLHPLAKDRGTPGEYQNSSLFYYFPGTELLGKDYIQS